MSASVLFETRDCHCGMRLAVATLNAPATLNSLTLEMCLLLNERLRAWENDPDVAVVILQATGDKAFCAGGDLHRLYRSMQDCVGGDPLGNRYAARFFEAEYRLDYLLHHYGKPLLVWGNGIVMGGGMGLMAGASHRVVSPGSLLAMPEITIGLFPDVGGSRILQGMPGHSGLFAALTGAQLGASDAVFAGLADFCIAPANWTAVIDALRHQEWVRASLADDADDLHMDEAAESVARRHNDMLLRQTLAAAQSPDALEPGPLCRHLYLINNLCGQSRLEDICDGISGLAGHEDRWLVQAAQTLSAGAPGSARLAYALNQRTRLMTLADVFRAEYWASLVCVAYGDLREGIRALLVDKDRQPRWNPATLAQADEAWVQRFFESPWEEGGHPLADLGD